MQRNGRFHIQSMLAKLCQHGRSKPSDHFAHVTCGQCLPFEILKPYSLYFIFMYLQFVYFLDDHMTGTNISHFCERNLLTKDRDYMFLGFFSCRFHPMIVECTHFLLLVPSNLPTMS